MRYGNGIAFPYGVSNSGISAIDSGQYGANLVSAQGVYSVTSPVGASFGQAAESAGASAGIFGAAGTLPQDGVINHAGWTAECWFQPVAGQDWALAAGPPGVAVRNEHLVGRIGRATAASVTGYFVDASASVHTLTSSAMWPVSATPTTWP